MFSTFTWFDVLNFSSAFITIIIAANFLFRKAFNEFKQRIAKLNKRVRLNRINKLRRQYFTAKRISLNQNLLIAYSIRNIGNLLILFMMMSFIGFIFLYLEQSIFKLMGGFYMLIILVIAIYHFDEFTDTLSSLKSPKDYLNKQKRYLNELRRNK